MDSDHYASLKLAQHLKSMLNNLKTLMAFVFIMSASLPISAQQLANPLSEAVDNRKLQFFSQGDAQFFVQSKEVTRGRSSAQSGKIFDNQRSILYTRAMGGDEVSFDWKVSSEFSYDGVIFTILDLNGNSVIESLQLTGEFDWENRSVTVPGLSPVFLVWAYVKDEIISEGRDAAWIDNVKVNDKSAEIVAGIVNMLLLEPFSYERSDLFPEIPSEFPGKSFVSIRSQGGDAVGGDNSYKYSQQNANLTIELDSNKEIVIRIDGVGVQNTAPFRHESWRWFFKIPKDRKISRGRYVKQKARNSSQRDKVADIYISSGTYGNCRVEGEFTIYEIEIEFGDITKLVADFIQTCNGIGTLRGSIYFDDSLPNATFNPREVPKGEPYPQLPALNEAGFVAEAENLWRSSGGGPDSFSYSSRNSNFSASEISLSDGNPGINLSITPGLMKRRLSADLLRGALGIDPDKDKSLSPGVYYFAFNDDTNGAVFPSLKLYPMNKREEVMGRFRIFDVEFSNAGEIIKLIADYQYREPSLANTLSSVSVHFDSTLPPPVVPPLPMPSTPASPALPELLYAGGVARIVSLSGQAIVDAHQQNSNIFVQTKDEGRTLSVFIHYEGDFHRIEVSRSTLDIDPNRLNPLNVGVYENANGSFHDKISHQIQYTSDDAGCNYYSTVERDNRFRIHEIEFDDDLNVTKLTMDFEQICPGSGSYFGSVKFDTTLPPHPPVILEQATGAPEPDLGIVSGNGVKLILIEDGVKETFTIDNAEFHPRYSGGSIWMNIRDSGSFTDKISIGMGPGSLNIDPNATAPVTPGCL